MNIISIDVVIRIKVLLYQTGLHYKKKKKTQNFACSCISAIGFQDLTPELQAEVQELQKRMAVEWQPLVLESSLTMQKILEARNHSERLGLVRYFMDAETKGLESKKTLKGIFSSTTTTTSSSSSSSSSTMTESMSPAESSIPPEEMISSDDKDNKSKPEETSSFFDDPDAFQ